MSPEEIEKVLSPIPKSKASPKDYLSTGSTLANLACTGHQRRGLRKGRYYLIVGDSSSGKSFLSLTCLAEAARSKSFDGYRFIYDAPERGADMNLSHFFGSGVDMRLESPGVDADGEPVHSSTVEDFYYFVDDAQQKGDPFIYILDSMDSLDSDDDREHFEKAKKASRGGKEIKGSYGMAKAKENSTKLRSVVGRLQKSGSILIIISQTRDNISDIPFAPKKTRAGGKSLKFYAAIEVWMSVAGEISREVRGKRRQLGTLAKLQVKKNRETGRHRSVEIPILHDLGIDDVGSCVDYLVSEGCWKKGSGGKINTGEFCPPATRAGVIALVESGGRERELQDLVAGVWREVERECLGQRKRRYGG